MRFWVLLSSNVIFFVFLCGCQISATVETVAFEQHYSSEGIQEVRIEIDAGRLNILQGGADEFVLNGIVTETTVVEVVPSGAVFSIIVNASQPADVLTLMVPDGLDIDVQTYSADIDLIDLNANADIRSTAGMISASHSNGRLYLWAGRGEILVQGGKGEATLVGEHGSLSIQQFEGNVSLTTIMGTMIYSAPENGSNQVKLESDHGPVKVSLPANANLTLKVRTTSGYVTCVGVGLVQTMDGCEGTIGEGTGDLEIRTVSGRVELRVFPEIAEENDVE